jgi:hypothetical protein
MKHSLFESSFPGTPQGKARRGAVCQNEGLSSHEITILKRG